MVRCTSCNLVEEKKLPSPSVAEGDGVGAARAIPGFLKKCKKKKLFLLLNIRIFLREYFFRC